MPARRSCGEDHEVESSLRKDDGVPDSKLYISDKDKLTDGDSARIQALIDRLASVNTPPDASNKPEAEYPKDYIYKDEYRIDNMIEELYLEGRKAFPLLVANSDDRRYSCTKVYAAHCNWTVGNVCFIILSNQVEAFGIHAKSTGGPPHSLWDIYFREKRLKEWWKTRQNWSLQRLQLDAIDHVIAGELNHKYKKERGYILEDLKKDRKMILVNALKLKHFGI